LVSFSLILPLETATSEAKTKTLTHKQAVVVLKKEYEA